MPYYNHVSTKKTIEFVDQFGHKRTHQVCPDCYDHPQSDISIAHDCKNLFWDGFEGGFKKIVDQCCCSSSAHGMRDGTNGKKGSSNSPGKFQEVINNGSI